MRNAKRGVTGRISEWWARSIWGWLVFLGPVICYATLFFSLEIFGLGGANPIRFLPEDPAAAFRGPETMALYGVVGRLEYAIVTAVFFLVACFSILWSVPRILFAGANPFGGFVGIGLSFGTSLFLFWLYINSDYQLRQIFADDLLLLGEGAGLIAPLRLHIEMFGVVFVKGDVPQSTILATSRDVIYFLGNAAPWCLIVLAARCASYEPRRFREESPASLRARITVLQIAVVLAAANIVLSVAYTRAMVYWPPLLLEEELANHYAVATARYSALWGILGTVLLITTLAPAYISVNRQLDRVATRQLAGDENRFVPFAERYAWRAKHGLIVSSQQAMTTGVAVIAPIMTTPALEAAEGAAAPKMQHEAYLDPTQIAPRRPA